MTPAFWGDIGTLAVAVAGLITWFIHSRSGSAHGNSRETKP